jgi:class 3 adenylate cyclase
VFDPKIAAHHGRLVKTTGDGFLAELVDALRCATEVQAQLAERNAPVQTDKCIDSRIGINSRPLPRRCRWCILGNAPNRVGAMETVHSS